MIGALKPYPEYKDSGVSLFGKIPKHWRIGPGFSAFREKHVKNTGMRETQVLSLSFGKIVAKSSDNLHGLVPESFETYQIVEPGDIIIRSTDLQNDWNSLRVGLVRDCGIITSAYLCLRATGILTHEYTYQLLHALDLMKVFYGLGSGLRQNLSFSDFKRMPILLPPLDEQEAIVCFLNHANRRMDRFIEAKERLIGLLNQQKRAILHSAVTRGINSNIVFRPSGIPWLGDIPEHWEVSRVKREFQCLNSRRVPLNSVERGAMTVRRYDYYGASGVIDKVAEYLFDDELLLVAEDGANLVLRNLPLAIIAKGKFWVNNHAHILKPKRGNLEYLAGTMESLNYQPWISGAAQPKLTQERLMSIAIGVAPLAEQSLIIEHLKKQTEPLDLAIRRIEQEIGLVHEYRARLSADVVMGKLDVHATARSLLNDVDDNPSNARDESVGVHQGDGQEVMEGISRETDT